VPAGGGELEALVLTVGQLEQEQQRVRVHHERMFARPLSETPVPPTPASSRLTGFSWL
jgi:hypothetical protein